jgi:hypothetical protein
VKSKAQIERQESKMSTIDDETKVSRTFDGSQKKFPMFMTWLKGILMYKGIVHIMKESFKEVLPASENESRQNADQKQAVKDNQIGMGILTMNVTSPLLIVKIEKLMTEEWPSGLFYKVIEMLNEKYRPRDMMSRAMQKQALMALKLTANEDPDDFGTAVSRLEIEYKHILTEEDKVTALVGAAGPA